jgi:hypothetical protein
MIRMIEVAKAIKSFLPAEQQADFASPDDPILEIPLSELAEDHARAIKARNHTALKEALV